MNDTPRTDAEIFLGFNSYGEEGETVVQADFSRELERELNAANVRIAELERAVQNWVNAYYEIKRKG